MSDLGTLHHYWDGDPAYRRDRLAAVYPPQPLRARTPRRGLRALLPTRRTAPPAAG